MKKLIFVYKADSGKLNAFLDIAHKAISPETYQCQLCSLTHGILKEKNEWKKYRESCSDELVFLHQDEFEEEYGVQYSYPVVLEERFGDLFERISSKEFEGMKDLSSLIRKVQSL